MVAEKVSGGDAGSKRMLLISPYLCRGAVSPLGNEVKWGHRVDRMFWEWLITGGQKKRQQQKENGPAGDWQSAGDATLLQSINKSFPLRLRAFISVPSLWPDTGFFPCVISVKGKVTFFFGLMGSFNNGENWEPQRRAAFSFFNGDAPGFLRLASDRASRTFRHLCFHYSNHTQSLQPWYKVTGAAIVKCTLCPSKYLNSKTRLMRWRKFGEATW